MQCTFTSARLTLLGMTFVFAWLVPATMLPDRAEAQSSPFWTSQSPSYLSASQRRRRAAQRRARQRRARQRRSRGDSDRELGRLWRRGLAGGRGVEDQADLQHILRTVNQLTLKMSQNLFWSSLPGVRFCDI